MATRNVFTYVHVRQPAYRRPDLEPNTATFFEPIDPLQPVPDRPIPVPLISDPDEELRFFSSARDATGATTSETIKLHAQRFVRSEHYFAGHPDIRPLLGVESRILRVLSTGPAILPLGADEPWVGTVCSMLAMAMPESADERWVGRVRRMLTAAVPEPADISDWIQSDDLKRRERVLWQSLYALTVVPEVRKGDRPRLMFWLRLFALLRLARTPELSGRSLEWRRLPISVPRLLLVTEPLPEKTLEDIDEAQAARESQERRNAIGAEIARLEGVIVAVEAFDEADDHEEVLAAPTHQAKPSLNPAQRGHHFDSDEADISASRQLRKDSLAPDHVKALETAGIRFAGRGAEEVIEAVEEHIDSLEAEEDALSRREIIAMRNGVLVRRTVRTG